MENKLYIITIIYNTLIEDSINHSKIPNHQQINRVFFDNSNKLDIQKKNSEFSEINKLVYYSLNENVGLSRAYNYCIKKINNRSSEKTWIMTLDQDTLMSKDYFLNMIDSINELDSYPLKTGEIHFNNSIGSPTNRFDSKEKMGKYIENGKVFAVNATAINSALTIRLDFLEKINLYDENIFLDMLDHLIILQLRSIGLDKIQIIEGEIYQEFSGDSIGTYDSDYARFKIYEKDLRVYKKITKMNYFQYKAIHLKRGIKLSWYHRKNFFKDNTSKFI